MSTTESIAKSIKVTFPKNVFILPFEGNLTQSKKVEITTRLQNHINTKMFRNVSFDDVSKAVWSDSYGSLEKNITVEKRDGLYNLSGKGWGSWNMPKEQLVIIH